MSSLVIVVCVLLAYWVFVATMLKAKISIPAEPGWHETDETEVPPQSVADAFAEAGEQLEKLGYTRGRLLARGQPPQKWWVRSFLEEKTGDQAFIMVSEMQLRTHRVVAFRADLDNGRRVFTQNSETAGMGVTVPGVATALPGVDVVLVHRVHKQVVKDEGGHITPRSQAAGVEDMAADHVLTMKSLVQQRVMSLHEGERAYRYTTLGAIWHVLRFARPWRDIRQWSRRRRAAALLAKVSGGVA